jgi:hypothetical protein
MTDPDKKRFSQCFNSLAVATRLPAAEGDAPMKAIYFRALLDLDIEAVESSARDLEKKAQWFPKVAEWRQAARLAHGMRNLTLALPGEVDRDRPWKEECDLCDDTGWRVLRCFPEVSMPCGVRRCKKSREHNYAVMCECRPTNRTYQRSLEHQYQAQR